MLALFPLAPVPVFDPFGAGVDEIDERTPAKLINICSNWFRSKPGGGVREDCCWTTVMRAASSKGGNDEESGGGGDDDDEGGTWTKVHGERVALLLLLKWTLIGLDRKEKIDAITVFRSQCYFRSSRAPQRSCAIVGFSPSAMRSFGVNFANWNELLVSEEIR